MADLSDDDAFKIFVLYLDGVSRREISEKFDVAPYRVFDRHVEERSKGTLAHPMFRHLPKRQGAGGGRPWHEPEMPEDEIWQRAAEVRSRRRG